MPKKTVHMVYKWPVIEDEKCLNHLYVTLVQKAVQGIRHEQTFLTVKAYLYTIEADYFKPKDP